MKNFSFSSIVSLGFLAISSVSFAQSDLQLSKVLGETENQEARLLVDNANQYKLVINNLGASRYLNLRNPISGLGQPANELSEFVGFQAVVGQFQQTGAPSVVVDVFPDNGGLKVQKTQKPYFICVYTRIGGTYPDTIKYAQQAGQACTRPSDSNPWDTYSYRGTEPGSDLEVVTNWFFQNLAEPKPLAKPTTAGF